MRSATRSLQNFLDNPYVSTTLGIALVLYGSLAAPQLPPYFARLFQNPIVRVVVLFLIAYMSTKNYAVALISAVALTLTLQTLNRYEFDDRLVSYLGERGQQLRQGATQLGQRAAHLLPEVSVGNGVNVSWNPGQALAMGNSGNGQQMPMIEEQGRYTNAEYMATCNDDYTPIEAVIPSPSAETPDPVHETNLYGDVPEVEGYGGADFAPY